MINDSLIVSPQLLVTETITDNSVDFPIVGNQLFVVTFISGYIQFSDDLGEAGFMVDGNTFRGERGLGVEVRSIVISPAWIPLQGGDTITAWANSSASMGFVLAGGFVADA